tara:strand:+ start:7377 stop:9305 length:1929 start_codon:yes stop_codon:yes gene_type:complete
MHDEIKLPKGSVLKKDIEDSKRHRQKIARIWDMCSLFLQGKQHLRWDRNLKNYVGLPQDRRGARVTINMVLNIFRNIQARLSVAYPSMTVLPASPSTEDIQRSEAAETLLRYYWHTTEMKDVISEALEWLLLTGNAAFHTFYDPKAQRVVTTALSPYDVNFESGATSPAESEWVAISHVVTRKALKESYPDHAEDIQKSAATPDHMYQTLYQRASGTEGAELKDRLEVYEVYTKDGKMGMLLGSLWLYKADWPTHKSPISFVRYTNIPGRLWGVGLIEPLIELQVMYNKGRSQVMQNAELMGNPKWLIPKSSGVGKDALSDSRPGEKVMYNATSGPPPQQVTAGALPAYVLDNIRQLSAEMLDVAGVHSTSLGKRAIGIESGAAIESLASRDSQQLQVTQQNMEKAMIEVATCVLEMCKVYYNEPRMMRMMDETGRVIHKTLLVTDLCTDPEVYLEAGTLFRDEKPDRDQRILEMVKLGLLDKDEALRALDYRTGNERVTKRMIGFSHAHDMLDAIMDGHAIEIMPSDDLEAFEEVFKSFMRTERYYQLPSERQDYIRDVLISVVSFGKEDEDFQRMEMEKTVFPRVEAKGKNAVQGMALMQSPMAAEQMGLQADQMAQRRALVDDANPEQGIGRTQMGGGG